MIPIEKLLDMVLGDAIEDEKAEREVNCRNNNLPSIRYNLELIEDSNSKLYWVED